MSGFEIVGLVLGGYSLLISASERLNGDRITHPQDVIMSFTELQAEQVLQIQSEIIKVYTERVSHRLTSETLSQETETLLHDRLGEALRRYAQALRDYETLGQELLQKNPFLRPEWHARLPEIIQFILGGPLHPYPDIEPYVNTLKLRELDKRGRLLREEKHASLERLILGSFGGFMLIGPMLLMVLNYNRNTTLITTSPATMLFTLVLATFARGMAGKDVLAAVAAYAAVLVVFVGTSIAPSSSA